MLNNDTLVVFNQFVPYYLKLQQEINIDYNLYTQNLYKQYFVSSQSVKYIIALSKQEEEM